MRKRLTFYVLRMTPLSLRPTLVLRRSPQTTPTSIYEAGAMNGGSPIRTKMGTLTTQMLRNADLRIIFLIFSLICVYPRLIRVIRVLFSKQAPRAVARR